MKLMNLAAIAVIGLMLATALSGCTGAEKTAKTGTGTDTTGTGNTGTGTNETGNATTANVSAADATAKIEKFEGDCSGSGVGVSAGGASGGTWAPGAVISVPFDVRTGCKGIVVEMVWSEATGAGDLSFTLGSPGYNPVESLSTGGTSWKTKGSESPLKIIVKAKELKAWVKEDGTFTTYGFVDMGAYVNFAWKVYASVFYGAEPTDTYTGIPSA
jgi:hypothetical protein